jgi:DNA topoisomerase VI subunit B
MPPSIVEHCDDQYRAYVQHQQVNVPYAKVGLLDPDGTPTFLAFRMGALFTFHT